MACLLVAAVAGCQKPASTAAPVLGLEAADVTPFMDIPVPLGFNEEYDPLTQINYETYKGPRSAYMHYHGGSDYLSVIRFYSDMLPEQKWKRQDEQAGSAGYYLYYRKGPETLIITVRAIQGNTDIILKLIPGDARGPGMAAGN